MNLESQNQDPIFDEIVKDFGFIPNLAKEMALSPAVLKFYFIGNEVFSGLGIHGKRNTMDQASYCYLQR